MDPVQMAEFLRTGRMPRKEVDQMQEFSRSVRGTRFFEHQLPELIKALNRQAAAQEKANELAEKAAQERAEAAAEGDRMMKNLLEGS